MFRIMTAIALAAVVAGSPAAAGDREADQALARVQDPATPQAIADKVGNVVQALAQLRIAPLINAVNDADPDNDRPPMPADTTVADLTGRDGADMAADAHTQSVMAARALGGVAGALKELLPQLEAIARTMGAQAPARD